MLSCKKSTTNCYYAGDMLVGQKTGSNKIDFIYDSNGDYYGFEYNDIDTTCDVISFFVDFLGNVEVT